MRLRMLSLPCLFLIATAGAKAQPAEDPATPAFTNVSELSSGFRLLYIQKFSEARAQFEEWENQRKDEPFGQVAIAASYLFEKFDRQGVLTVENGRYLQPFAKIMLALAARREKQNKLAQKLLHELREEFPESPQYAAEYAKAMGRPIPASMQPEPR